VRPLRTSSPSSELSRAPVAACDGELQERPLLCGPIAAVMCDSLVVCWSVRDICDRSQNGLDVMT